MVVAGLEPFAVDDLELTPTEVPEAASEWCTNLDCPSNHAVRGLWRVGVNDYRCKVCGDLLRTPMSAVLAPRKTQSSAAISARICRREERDAGRHQRRRQARQALPWRCLTRPSVAFTRRGTVIRIAGEAT